MMSLDIEYLQSPYAIKCMPMVVDEDYPSYHLQDMEHFLSHVKDPHPKIVSKFKGAEIRKYVDRNDPVYYYIAYFEDKPIFASEVWNAKFSGDTPEDFIHPKVQTSVELVDDRFKGIASFVAMNLIARGPGRCMVTDIQQTPLGEKFWVGMLHLNHARLEAVVLTCPLSEKPNTVTVLSHSPVLQGNRIPRDAWSTSESGRCKRVAFRMKV